MSTSGFSHRYRSPNRAFRPQLGTVVVGGGPAGLALLLSARQGGLLGNLLSSGLRIIERTQVVGPGEIGNYAIRSDSLAGSFLKTVDIETSPPLRQLLKLTAGSKLDAQRGSPIDLPTLARFLADMAIEFRSQLPARHVDPFLTGLEAIRARRQSDRSWITDCRRSDGALEVFRSRTIVITTGASQPVQRLFEERVAGAPLLPRFAAKTVQSGEFLASNGLLKMTELLSDRVNPKVAIVGGSHSALASAFICMDNSHGISFGPESITVLHRGDLRLTYTTPAEAFADGYRDFGPADICPKTGRVFPLAGFRCDSRDILRRHWGLGGLAPNIGLRLFKLEESGYEEANRILEEADLIVAALGYRPRGLPLYDENNEPLDLLSKLGGGPLVDEHSRVLNAQGTPISGVFAMGLADGYPLGGIHGEPSFTGQANGLALWQSDIGRQIVRNLLDQTGTHTTMPKKSIH